MEIKTEVAVYDEQFLPYYLSKGTDLLGELYQFPAFVVDNHTPWRRLARQHPTFRFVIGRTYSNEVDDLRGALANAKAEGLLENVIVFETFCDAIGVRYRLTRVDREHLATLNQSVPRLSAMHPSELEKFDDSVKRKRICDHILEQLSWSEDRQLQCIARLKGSTRYQVVSSIELAVASHVVTVRKMPAAKRRNEIAALKKSERSVMNDTYLLQEALVLGCGVHTQDEKLKCMCRRSGVRLFPTPRAS